MDLFLFPFPQSYYSREGDFSIPAKAGISIFEFRLIFRIPAPAGIHLLNNL
jgi:hypothetical protein